VSEKRVLDHLKTVVDRIDDEVLPPHYPTCLGCGPEAEAGFHLQVRRDGDEVVAEHVFAGRQSGAPGIAHGGAVATVVDDVLGFLLYVVRAPGVTRRLEVDYLKPVLIGVPYVVRARVDRREGRKIWVSCEGTGPDGVIAFRATGLFVVVELSHFAQATSGGGQGPVAP
jgi:acyl-coenzyme A thioesterase PaaI-like protein